MTIYKFQQIGKKPKADEEQPDVLNESLTGDKDKAVKTPKSPNTIHVTFIPKKSKACLNLSLLFFSLLVLSAGVVGGIYLYTHLRQKVVRLRCGFTYVQDMMMKNHKPALPSHSSKLFSHGHANPNHPSISFFEENVEVIDNYFERVEIPKFDDCKDAVIFHDFERNYTTIVDKDIRKCFVMKLNQSVIAPPKNLTDLLAKLDNGYYVPRATVVRQTYTVMHPATKNLSILGQQVRKECEGFDTYMLRKLPKNRSRLHGRDPTYGLYDHKTYLHKLDVLNISNML
ncbi:integral membrane protein 2B-like [Argonauta hians]